MRHATKFSDWITGRSGSAGCAPKNTLHPSTPLQAGISSIAFTWSKSVLGLLLKDQGFGKLLGPISTFTHWDNVQEATMIASLYLEWNFRRFGCTWQARQVHWPRGESNTGLPFAGVVNKSFCFPFGVFIIQNHRLAINIRKRITSKKVTNTAVSTVNWNASPILLNYCILLYSL